MGRVSWDDRTEFKVLEGKILTKVEVNDNRDEIRFHAEDGTVYLMYHEQDCCEGVSIEGVPPPK